MSSSVQVSPLSCHYLVDQITPQSTQLEPQYADDAETWHTVTSFPFLDNAR